MAKIISIIDLGYIDNSYELVKFELTDKELSEDAEKPILSSLYPHYRYVVVMPIDSENLCVFYLCSRSKNTTIPTKHVDFLCNLIKFSSNINF